MDRFNKQLETENIPYKDIIKANDSFVDALYNEFKALPLKPDLNLYIGSKMDLLALSEELETNRPPTIKSKDRNTVFMAQSVGTGTLESQFNTLKTEFHKLKVIEKKYYGAFLFDAPTVKTLKELSDKIDLFEKYVTKNNNDFIPYAERKAKEVIAILNKLDNNDLKKQLLINIINSKSNKEIVLDSIHFDLNMNLSIKANEDLLLSYDTIKGYFNEVLESELENIAKNTGLHGLKDNYEVAIRQYFLENKKIVPMIFGKEITLMYSKKVEVFINELRKSGLSYKRRGLEKQLINVSNTLNEYPEIKKEIEHHLTKIE